MSYYTSYKASFAFGQPFIERVSELNELTKQADSLTPELKAMALTSIEKEWIEIDLMQNAEYLISKEVGYNVFYQPMSQWDHKGDMVKISKKYPTVVFKLEGHGEEKYDIWVEYYCDGKVQKCEAVITFENFDYSKLQ